MTVTAVIRDVLIEKRLVAMECGECGVDFALGENFIANRKEDKQSWYCPNGHCRVFLGKTREERAIAERDAARSLAERESRRRKYAEEDAAHAKAQARLADYQRRAAKGQLTKIRKRIANGVCPCCNRTFTNLAEHMAGQHPEFVLPEGVEVP